MSSAKNDKLILQSHKKPVKITRKYNMYCL